MMLKQVFKKNIFIFITIFLSGFFILILSHNLYKATIYEVVSNNLYDKDTSHFVQLNHVDLQDLISICDNTFISKEVARNMRGIYFSSKYNYKLPTIEGRFFNYNDFRAENNYVVIGKGLQQFIFIRDNKKFYNLNNKEYEVIGILGIDAESRLDYFVLFNLTNIYSFALSKTNIAFGGKTEKINDELNKQNLSDNFARIEIPNTGISRIWGSSNIYIMVISCIYLCLIVTVLFLILLKSKYYIKYIRTFNIMGFKDTFTYKSILLSEFFIYVTSLVLGEVLAFTLFFKKYFSDSILIAEIIKISLISCSIYILFSYILFNLEYRKLTCAGEEK